MDNMYKSVGIVKDYLNDDVIGEIVKYIPVLTDENIRQVVKDWCAGGKSKENIEAMYGHICRWDVSRVSDMTYLFKDMKYFNDDISKWNVSNVTNMEGLFFGAKSFNQPLNIWNVSNVTNVKWLFAYTTSFNQPLNNWNVSNVSNVTDMFGMFAGAKSFNAVYLIRMWLNLWTVGMCRMCQKCQACFTVQNHSGIFEGY